MEGPRGTKKEEFDAVIRLANSVFRQEKQSMQAEYSILFNDENLENMRIILEDGKPVSHIGLSERDISICGCHSRVGSIGAVCTDPAYRGKGYANILLQDCIRRADERGADFLLVSGDRSLYDRADCLRAGKIYRYIIKKFNVPQLKGSKKISAEQFKDSDLPDMVKTYNSEPVRFIRPIDDWKISLTCGQIMNRPGIFIAIKESGSFKAYLAVNFYGENSKLADVMEYAGSRKHILESVPVLFEQYNLDRIHFNVPFQDERFADLVKNVGLEVSVNPNHGTVRILNFTRLMQRMRPYFIKKAGIPAEKLNFKEGSGKFIISLGRERLLVENRRIMTMVVLGTPGDYTISEKGKLADVLKQIFPMPFVWPGLNYV